LRNRWICGLHDQQRVLCTGRRLHRSMLGAALQSAPQLAAYRFVPSPLCMRQSCASMRF
jgi:hypothetical protein